MESFDRHEHQDQQASDTWTRAAAAGEAMAGFVSDAYWIAGCIDVITGFEEDALGLSYWGLGFGCALALLSAGGAAYCHLNVNITHQQALKPADGPGRPGSREYSPLLAAAEGENYSTDPENNNPVSLNGSRSEKGLAKHVSLSPMQKIALVGDFISHTGEIAGPLSFVVNLASKGNLPRWGAGVATAFAGAIGAVSSVANVRTCKNNMLDANAEA